MKALLNSILIATTLAFGTIQSKAQQYIEVGTGIGADAVSPVVSFHKNWELGAKKKFIIGSGLRYTGFFGKDIYFTSAPNDLAIDPKSIDSLLAPTPALHSLNVMINLGYNINDKIQVGFNIDALGFSFGPTGTPTFISNGKKTSTKASPSSPNLLLVGNNDKGSLNSHFYGKYKFNNKWGVKLAYQYLFNELTSATKIQTVPSANDRFRVKSGQIFIGLNYSL